MTHEIHLYTAACDERYPVTTTRRTLSYSAPTLSYPATASKQCCHKSALQIFCVCKDRTVFEITNCQKCEDKLSWSLKLWKRQSIISHTQTPTHCTLVQCTKFPREPRASMATPRSHLCITHSRQTSTWPNWPHAPRDSYKTYAL